MDAQPGTVLGTVALSQGARSELGTTPFRRRPNSTGTWAFPFVALAIFCVSGTDALDLSQILVPSSNQLDSGISNELRAILNQNGFSDSTNCVVPSSSQLVVENGCVCSVNSSIWDLEFVNTTLGQVGPRFRVNESNLVDACDQGNRCGKCAEGSECLGILSSTNDRGICAPCAKGQFCPESVVNPFSLVAANLCPSGFVCVDPKTLEVCPEGFFCPEGSSEAQTCDVSGIDRGSYCPPGSFALGQPCPAGFFCPNPGLKVVCPKGSYCPKGSFQPLDCEFLTRCNAGSENPGLSYAGFIIVIILLIFIVALGAFFLRRHKHHRDSERKLNAELDQKRKLRAQLFEFATGRSLTAYKFEGFKKKTSTIQLKFSNLSLTLKENGKTILHGVTGEFKPGNLYAVMGPSGSGKTSFINALTGKGNGYGHIGGNVLVNGAEVPVDAYRKVMGFVPQTDVVHTTLTVRENLLFSARLRLPPWMKTEEIEAIVSDVIGILQLSSFQDKLVGSIESKQRISGGQRKRVNVGLELVSNPTLLILDEPTTGLDSAGAFEVVGALKTLASLGWTIITVIHQPRYSIFKMFHEVLFLGMGGYSVYLGPSERAVEYFREIGFEIPETENPADAMMDIVAGLVHLKGSGFDVSKLPELWQANQSKYASVSEGKETQSPSRKRRTSMGFNRFQIMQDLDSRWSTFDKDNSGTLSISDFESLFAAALGVEYSDDIKVLVGAMFKEYDGDLDGQVTREQFVSILLRENTNDGQMEAPIPEDDVFVARIEEQLRRGTAVAMRAKKVVSKGVRHLGRKFFADKFRSYGSQSIRMTTDATKIDEALRRQGRKPNGLVQFVNFFIRGIVQSWRDRYVKLFEITVLLVAIFIIGAIQGSAASIRFTLAVNVMLAHLGFSLVSGAASLRLFGFKYEKLMYWREASTGLSGFAYFVAKNLVDLLDMVYRSILFSLLYYYLTLPELEFGDFLLVSVMLSWAVSGIAYMVSTFFAYDDANVAFLVITLVLNGFLNGVNPRLGELEGGFLYYLVALSPSRWSVEAVAVKVAAGQTDDFPNLIAGYLADSGYKLSRYDDDLIALLVLGLVYRLFAFLCLKFTNRANQI